MTTTTIDPLTVARHYATADWDVEPRFDQQQRWYARLHNSADLEVWLLTWLPGQGTDLHDHGGSSGAMWIVSGTLTELTVAAAATRPHLVESPIGPGDGHGFGEHYIHQVVNHGTEPAVSVHAYSPGLTRMTRYAITDGRLEVVAVDAEGAQW